MERPTVAFGPADAESAEDVLRRRAESLAAEQDDQQDAEELLSLLLFAVGEEWYAVPIQSVREIYNEFVVTPVPCVPPGILGVINIRGEIISVTDVRHLLRTPGQAEGDTPVIVVENAASSTALLVDAIGDVVDVSRTALEPAVAGSDKSQANAVSGSVFIDGKLIGLLDLEAVLAPIGAAV